MRDWLEDFKQYLPKYLSPDATQGLFEELKQFPRNIDGRLYTQRLKDESNVFQGDGLADLPVVDLPGARVGNAKVMVLSNTCDLAPENARFMPGRVVYCPVMSFAGYERFLRQSEKQVPENHFEDIRMQRVSSMFFLPRNDALGEDAIAMLDRINNCDAGVLKPAEVPHRRIFTLSDYGFYLFLYKISLHFTRIREGVARSD